MATEEQFDEQLRRLASRSMQERESVVDVDAALDAHRQRVEHPTVPSARGRRWWAVAAAFVVVAVGVAAIAWPRDGGAPGVVSSPSGSPLPIATDGSVVSTAPGPESSVSSSGEVAVSRVDLRDGFSAESVFASLPASVTTSSGGSLDGSEGRLEVVAVDVEAAGAAMGLSRPADGEDVDAWISALYGEDRALEDVTGAVAAGGLPFDASAESTSQERSDGLGFDLVDVETYATVAGLDTTGIGAFRVYVGDTVGLAAGFVDVGGGVSSLGSGDDFDRTSAQISPVRPLGIPIRAIEQSGLVATSASTTDITGWLAGGVRLIDDDRFRAASVALDRVDLLDVTAIVSDFAANDDTIAGGVVDITEPFEVVTAGTTLIDSQPATVVAYVFADNDTATSMVDKVDTAWRRPSPNTASAAADAYTNITVEAVGRTVTVTAILEPDTNTTHWFTLLAQGEAVFAYTPG